MRLAFFDSGSGGYPKEEYSPQSTPSLYPLAKIDWCGRGRGGVSARGNPGSPGAYLAFFDFDSTLIEQEIIDELAALKGRKDEVAEITRETMEGKHRFSETILLKTRVLQGLSLDEVALLAKKIRFRKNVWLFLGWLKKNDFKTAVISGSFDNVLSLIPEVNEFDFVYANSLAERGGVLTGECVARVADNKGEIAARLKKELGVPTERCLAVGDGSTDIPVFRQSGFSVALNAKPCVKEAASVSLDTNDFNDLIPLVEDWLETIREERVF